MKIKYILLIFSAAIISACNWNKIPKPLTVTEAVSMAKESLQNNENVSIFDATKLNNLDTAIFFEGTFSPDRKKEVIVMCFAKDGFLPCNSIKNSPPPFETAHYLLMKLVPKRGKWVPDWIAQENKITAESIIDIDNDGLSELIFEGEYLCKGGMTLGYYYIITFKQNDPAIIYQKISENQLTTWPNPNISFYEGAVLIDIIKVKLEDIDGDNIKEILETRTVLEYHGGESLDEIKDSATHHKIIDTVFLTELEFEEEFD